MGQERRRDVRARITVRAEIVRGREAEAVDVLNASYRGLLVRLREPVPTLRLMKLRIHLPTRILETHGVSARVEGPTPSGSWQIGLRFFALNGEDQRDWERFVTTALKQFAQAA